MRNNVPQVYLVRDFTDKINLKHLTGGSNLEILNKNLTTNIYITEFTGDDVFYGIILYSGVDSAFLIEKHTPRFTFGKKEKKLGLRGSPTRELIFENCPVPEANLIGQEGMGFRVAMGALDGGRVTTSCANLGLALAAFESAVQYANIRVEFGKPIS